MQTLSNIQLKLLVLLIKKRWDHNILVRYIPDFFWKRSFLVIKQHGSGKLALSSAVSEIFSGSLVTLMALKVIFG